MLTDRRKLAEFFTDHLGNEFNLGKLFYSIFSDQLSVSKDGDAVAYFINLFKEMCNKNDPDPFGLKVSHKVEEHVNFFVIE